jgi:hypothetical protein
MRFFSQLSTLNSQLPPRDLLFNTTQAIRPLVGEEFFLQWRVHPMAMPMAHGSPAGRLVRRRIVEAIQHPLAFGESPAQAVHGFQNDAIFTRFATIRRPRHAFAVKSP